MRWMCNESLSNMAAELAQLPQHLLGWNVRNVCLTASPSFPSHLTLPGMPGMHLSYLPYTTSPCPADHRHTRGTAASKGECTTRNVLLAFPVDTFTSACELTKNIHWNSALREGLIPVYPLQVVSTLMVSRFCWGYMSCSGPPFCHSRATTLKEPNLMDTLVITIWHLPSSQSHLDLLAVKDHSIPPAPKSKCSSKDDRQLPF